MHKKYICSCADAAESLFLAGYFQPEKLYLKKFKKSAKIKCFLSFS
jgi:hypothetical protein